MSSIIKSPHQMVIEQSLLNIIHNYFSDATKLELDCIKIKNYFEPILKKYGYREENKNNRQNILICHGSAIGDFIVMSVYVNAIRKKNPDAFITLFCNKTVKGLLNYISNIIDEVITFEYVETLVTVERIAKYTEANVKKLLKRKYDVVYLPDARSVNLLSAYLSGAKCICGRIQTMVGLKHYEVLYNKTSNYHMKTALESYMYMLDETDKSTWQYYILDPKDQLSEKTNTITIGVGGMLAHKHLAADIWIKVIQLILDCYPNVKFQLLAGNDMIDLANKIENNTDSNRVTNFVGKLSIYESLVKAANSDLVISNDTCVAHMAAAASVPVIIIYSCFIHPIKDYWNVFSKAPSFQLLPPKLLECSNCDCSNGDNLKRCIKRVTADQIYDEFQRFTKEHLIIFE